MSTHPGRRFLLHAVFAVVVLAVAGPTLDLVLFGLHEHVAAAAYAKGERAPRPFVPFTPPRA